MKEITALAEARKFEEAKILARREIEELQNCVVAENNLIKVLINDLRDAVNRVSN